MTKADTYTPSRWPGRRTICRACQRQMIPVDGQDMHPACSDRDGVYGAGIGTLRQAKR